MNLLVTGGCGFIGSNFIQMIFDKHPELFSTVVNLDSLTYAADIQNTDSFCNNQRYVFENIDLCDFENLSKVFTRHNITHVVHFAAESHVDNSIADPAVFIQSNIVGTFNLLLLARKNSVERFHHVSTDEVYGELGTTGKFTEKTAYDPRNPYSASKAASDFLVKSYFHTYSLPVTISNCSNNYGSKQHDEKFIPTVIKSILNKEMIPVYGDGKNVRDWIFVDDHCQGVLEVLFNGKLGETYCIGAECEKTNLQVIDEICNVLNVNPEDYIKFVTDRLGHDRRYAIDNTKMKTELGWEASTSFSDGIRKTVKWYNE